MARSWKCSEMRRGRRSAKSSAASTSRHLPARAIARTARSAPRLSGRGRQAAADALAEQMEVLALRVAHETGGAVTCERVPEGSDEAARCAASVLDKAAPAAFEGTPYDGLRVHFIHKERSPPLEHARLRFVRAARASGRAGAAR
jgi:histone H3/H4